MPKISKLLGRKSTLFFALLVISLSYIILGLLPPWFLVITLTFFTGFGSGIIESTVGALVIQFVKGVAPHCHQPKKTGHPQNNKKEQNVHGKTPR